MVAADSNATSALIRALLRSIDAETVLLLGGRLPLARQLARHHPTGGSLYVVDHDPAVVAWCRHQLAPYPFVDVLEQDSITFLTNWHSEPFDAIIPCDTQDIRHLAQILDLVRARPLVRPDGLLLIPRAETRRGVLAAHHGYYLHGANLGIIQRRHSGRLRPAAHP